MIYRTENEKMTIGKNILRRCKELNLTIKDLSILSRVPNTTLHNIVSDKSIPRVDSIKKIAIALHTTADKLLFDEDDINAEDELRILFIEITKMPYNEQRTIKEMIRALIIQSKTRELAFETDKKV